MKKILSLFVFSIFNLTSLNAVLNDPKVSNDCLLEDLRTIQSKPSCKDATFQASDLPKCSQVLNHNIESKGSNEPILANDIYEIKLLSNEG